LVIFISFGKHNFTFIKSTYTIAPKGNHAFGGYMLNTNKNLTVENLPNNRAKKLAWMRESYSWHLIFTDHMANTYPPINYLSPVFSFLKTNFGKNTNEQCQQGPPTGANTNA